jgi:hypothetical protein
MKDAEEMPEAALEAAIPKATDALYDTREGEGNMHEAGKAAAVAALKAALPVLQAEDDEDLGQIRALVMGEEGLGDEDLGLIQKIERLVNLNRRICKADAVMLLTEKGHAGAVRFKGIKGSIPFEVEVSYGEKDDPPLTIRQVKITAGWKRPDWRKMDRSELHDATQEARDATQEEARA